MDAYNKVPQTRWLKTTEICLTVLEARNSNHDVDKIMLFSKIVGETLSLPLSLSHF
jgi:hypothetical protein